METPQNQTATVLVTRTTPKCVYLESSLHTVIRCVSMQLYFTCNKPAKTTLHILGQIKVYMQL